VLFFLQRDSIGNNKTQVTQVPKPAQQTFSDKIPSSLPRTVQVLSKLWENYSAWTEKQLVHNLDPPYIIIFRSWINLFQSVEYDFFRNASSCKATEHIKT